MMSKQKKGKKRWWVSRDRMGFGFYCIYHMIEKPLIIAHSDYRAGKTLQRFKSEEFRKLFTLRLRKGECKEIEQPTLILK